MKYLKQQEKKKTNPMKIVAIVMASMAGLLLVATAGMAIFVMRSNSIRGDMFAVRQNSVTVPTVPTEEPAPTKEGVIADWIDDEGNAYVFRDDIITILVMGVDYMADSKYWNYKMESNGGNADVMGLVILNTETFDFNMLYIPRDTMADVIVTDAEGNYQDMIYTNITTAHSYGDGKELSCRLTCDAVSRLLCGIPVNRYVAMDYDAIYKLNDMLGGLNITFDRDYTEIHGSFKKGVSTTLNSYYLKRFITYRDHRDVEGATVRGERSMQVLKAMFRQCRSQIAEDPTIALKYVEKLHGYLTMDMSASEISFLGSNVGKMDFGDKTLIRLPGEVVRGEKYAEFYADEQWIHDFVVEKLCIPAE